MKKVFLAFLLSFIFILIYTFFSVVMVSIIYGNPMMNEPSAWQTPLQIPYYVYYNFAPESLQYLFYSNPFGTLLLKIILFFGNVLLYTIPFYLIVKVIASLKSEKFKNN